MLFDVVFRKDEAGYYIATFPELPGCHTQSKRLDDLMSTKARFIKELKGCVESSRIAPLEVERIWKARSS